MFSNFKCSKIENPNQNLITSVLTVTVTVISIIIIIIIVAVETKPVHKFKWKPINVTDLNVLNTYHNVRKQIRGQLYLGIPFPPEGAWIDQNSPKGGTFYKLGGAFMFKNRERRQYKTGVDGYYQAIVLKFNTNPPDYLLYKVTEFIPPA